uniref:NADH-ubiquinone oxidoreductase chain 2 n=1 Tax=Nepanthia sp. M04 TaxID=2779942 RepID=A0A7S8HPW5_9ECHI|nr:NADH dehydrogenase subunit 2 [Nepanthia sp. M04]
MSRVVLIFLVVGVVLGVVIVLSSGHWFTLWVGLEMNTLSMLPILGGKFTVRGVESMVKYFLVQAVGAAMILNVAVVQCWLYSSWFLSHPLQWGVSLVVTLALGLKIGLFPCHYWFPDVVQGVGFMQGLVLSTWQKVAPLAVLVSVVNSLSVDLLVSLGVLSVLVGGWGGLNQSQVRKILAFSSIGHMGWVCSTILYSVRAGLVMLVVYMLINSSVFLVVKVFDLKSLFYVGRLSMYSFVGGLGLVLGVLSLGGLPPLFGFLNKFVSLSCLVGNGCIVFSGFMVGGSLLSLFFYLRVAFNGGLVLFPQHLLVVFGWRSLESRGSLFTLEGVLLSW